MCYELTAAFILTHRPIEQRTNSAGQLMVSPSAPDDKQVARIGVFGNLSG